MKNFILFLAFFMPVCVFSQFSDNFSDGNFNQSPVWTGSTGHFKVNPELQLQLSAPKDGSPSYLSTPSQRAQNTSWTCWARMKFSPTSSNYCKIYLCADQQDLTGELHGLYIRLGYTNKNISLISQTGTTANTLINGATKRLDATDVALQIKATLDEKGNFNLYAKLDGEKDYSLEGSCRLPAFPVSSYMGVACIYTSTRNESFFFDDFNVRILDESKEGSGGIVSAIDSSDLVINELLFNPLAGSKEYVELYNRSLKEIDISLLGITTRKSDGTLNKSYPLALTSSLLQPGEYLLITHDKELICNFYRCEPGAHYAELSTMPVITNTSGCVVLVNNWNNKVIDELAYNEKMHESSISNKKGVSLERIDTEVSSTVSTNWHSASSDAGYGTPGYANSQQVTAIGDNISILPPQFGVDSYQIRYHFQHPAMMCRALVYNTSGQLVHTIANNELLGTQGTLYWNGDSVQRMKAGVYIIYMEVRDESGKLMKYKLPVVVN